MKNSYSDQYYHRIGVYENSFMFTSSPNFKNMKKYLKNKITTYEATADELVQKLSSSENSPVANEQKPVIPPLPVVPPPPIESPTQAILAIPKKEIIEQNEYEPSSSEFSNTPVPKIKTELKINAELQQSLEERSKKKIPICKNFLRHNCTRRVCMFRHEFDITQLHGVYQFCKDYQNSVCRFPNCKYVHASVFEQERFYETGILPPHALSHQKRTYPVNKPVLPNGPEKSFFLLPPPPPPPPPPPSNKPQRQGMAHVSPKIKVNMNLTNPPPPVHIGLQTRRLKLDSLTKSSIDINEKITTLDKKHKRLLICLFSYIKPAGSQGNLNDIQGSLGHLFPTLKLPDNTAYAGNTVSNVNYMTGMFQQDNQDKANLNAVQGSLGHLFSPLKLPENAVYAGNPVTGNGSYVNSMFQQDDQDKASQVNLNKVQDSLGHLFPSLKLSENAVYAGNTVNNGSYANTTYQQDDQDKMIEQLKSLINAALMKLNNDDASQIQMPPASSFPNINIGLKPQHNTWTSHS